MPLGLNDVRQVKSRIM